VEAHLVGGSNIISSNSKKNDKASGLNQRQIASSADLGGSSNYSKETLATAFNFED